MNEIPEATNEASKEIQDHEAESALRTILEAEKIKRNAPLMEKVKALASSQHQDLGKLSSGDDKKSKSVADLRKKAAEMED